MYPIRIITRVLAILNDHEIRVVVGPGVGSLDDGSHQTWAIETVPEKLRFPNAEFWMVLDSQGAEPRIEAMEA